MQTCSLSHAAFPPALDPLPVLTDRFDSREEGPCVKSVWQSVRAGARPAHTAELQAPITEMCVTPSVIPLLLTQVRFGKDGHFRATGDNQIRSHSIKYFLDYAKGVREWDAEEKPRWHRKCLVLMTYST